MMRTAILRAANAPSRQLLARRTVPAACQQTRKAHAISNPTLADIEHRWEKLPPQEQADLWMALRDRMKVDWNDLTMQEKKAGMWHYRSFTFGDSVETSLL
jgi:cytochrome c oxidase subunit 4